MRVRQDRQLPVPLLPRRIAGLALVAVLAAALPAAATTLAPRPAEAALRVVVTARPGHLGAVAARVQALGGTLRRPLPMVDAVAATLPAAAARALAADPAVRSLTPDSPVRVSSEGSGTIDPDEPTATQNRTIRADQVWSAGYRGQGVTVAVVDTGVTPGSDLAGRMVPVADALLAPPQPCKNLSGEPTCADGYGHGTFVAGLIAGNGSASGGLWSGVAPEARILSVKVAGADGASDVSTVLAAIQWVVSYKNKYNIRVLNLSLSTDSTQTYRTDPFNFAVERAWDAGIVVVVSASNRGPSAGTIAKPADDPLVITAGAVDDRGTPALADDEVPDFSAHGPTAADGLAKPDLVAPGAHVVSMRSPGSAIDGGAGTLDGAYHRGSGTSFSAGVVSGVAALMLNRTPSLTPNQVKYAMVASARPVPASSDPLVVGAGVLDAAAATLSPPTGSANAGVVRSNGTGLLSASRGHVEVQTTTVPATVVNGTLTAQLLVWDPAGYLVGWNPTSWQVSTWALFPLVPTVWSANDWPGHNWGGHNWGGGNWEGSAAGGVPQQRQYGFPIEGAIWYGAWG